MNVLFQAIFISGDLEHLASSDTQLQYRNWQQCRNHLVDKKLTKIKTKNYAAITTPYSQDQGNNHVTYKQPTCLDASRKYGYVTCVLAENKPNLQRRFIDM